MRGLPPWRLLFLVIVPALMCVGQGFWCVRAWRVIDAIAWPGPRYLLRGLWMAAMLVVLATVLDPMIGPVIPRGGLRTWMLAVSRLRFGAPLRWPMPCRPISPCSPAI